MILSAFFFFLAGGEEGDGDDFLDSGSFSSSESELSDNLLRRAVEAFLSLAFFNFLLLLLPLLLLLTLLLSDLFPPPPPEPDLEPELDLDFDDDLERERDDEEDLLDFELRDAAEELLDLDLDDSELEERLLVTAMMFYWVILKRIYSLSFQKDVKLNSEE